MKSICRLAIFALLCCAAPAWADEGTAASSPLCPLFAAGGGSALRVSGPTSFAVCTADCGDGSYVSCSGSSCEAEDSNCPFGVRGTCWSDAEGTKYCPHCPHCSTYDNCSCEGDPCTKNLDCGTCFGAACFCTTQQRCICL